jgi:hypothetical protein
VATGSDKNYVDSTLLAAVLDWLLRRRDGDPSAKFSLTLIKFDNPALLGQAYGAPRAARVLDHFGLTIVGALRSGDLVTRVLTTFWVLTQSGNIQLLLDRLSGVIAGGAEDGLDMLKYSVRSYNFPNPLASAMSGAELLSALEKNTLLRPDYMIEGGCRT